jgi:hypothetical protein
VGRKGARRAEESCQVKGAVVEDEDDEDDEKTSQKGKSVRIRNYKKS